MKLSKKAKYSFLILLSIVVWVGLTKTGMIPNFLGWEIFCSEEKEPQLPIKPKPNQKNIAPSDSTGGHHHKPVDPEPGVCYKPNIYLYPVKEQNITVQLDYKGEIIADYPVYNQEIKGWKVTAFPDGRIINNIDNKEYSYLFWEGKPEKLVQYDLSKGFVVKGEDTRAFLQNTLSEIGLTPKEYNEFIVYWYPKMKENPYNLIHFAEEEYTSTAPLKITPTPDAILRVFMVYKPLDHKIEVKEQKIKSFERKGFTVVEWGGTYLEKENESDL